jgi:pimeloyl-ACP methyl ester carboxylesterase
MKARPYWKAHVGLLFLFLPWSLRAETLPWVRQEAGNHSAIVFVHGLLGDDRSTWSSGKAYWPAMLTSDPAFKGQNIYVYRYPSPRLGRSLTVDEIADDMHLVLKTDGVLQHDELTFICHSMGGIVTRAYILKYRNEVVRKIRLLYFFATPTTGSALAAVASLFSRNPQFKQLYSMDNPDSYVGALQSQWLAADLKLKSYCAYETQPTLGRLVVERQSATNLCTQALVPIDADHIGIVKPSSPDSITYRALKAAFMDVPTLVKTGNLPARNPGKSTALQTKANSPAYVADRSKDKAPPAASSLARSRCGSIPAASGPAPSAANDIPSVVVTRSSSSSGANVRDFVTTGRGRYDVDMLVPNWRPEALEFRFGSWSQTVNRGLSPFSLGESGHPLAITRFTDYGFEIDDNECAGIPYSVIWIRGEPAQSATADPRAAGTPATSDPAEKNGKSSDLPSISPPKVNQGGNGSSMVQVNNAPNGILVAGGTVTNPTVNNYGPRSRRLTADEEESLKAALSGSKARVIIWFFGGDDTQAVAQDFYDVFVQAGWEMSASTPEGAIQTEPQRSDIALFLPASSANEPAGAAETALVSAMKSSWMHLSVGTGLSGNIPGGSVKLVVGPRWEQ